MVRHRDRTYGHPRVFPHMAGTVTRVAAIWYDSDYQETEDEA